MAQAFNLTAQLNLRGPRNVNSIVRRINRQLGNINANVNLNINNATQTAINNVNASLTNLNRTLATTATNTGNVTTAINNLTGAFNALGNLNVNQQLNNTANAVQQLGNNAANAAGGGAGAGAGVQGLRTELEEFGRQSALAVRRFAAFSLVTSVIFGLSNAFNKAFQSFVDFDKEFVRLQQVTGESANGLKSLSKTISSLAISLGTSSAELANVSSTLAQAGLTARDTEKALKALALSALAPSFDNMNNTVEGSIALMRQFGISAGQLEASLGSVNAVAAAFAVEAGDIIAAIQRTGGVFASASKGVSEGTDALNEFIAIFTSVRQTTRESAETIATGLRTIFTRIQRSSTIEALKEFNVNLTDAEGKFVGAYKAIELLSRGLNSIDPRDLKFSEIVEELGGFRQIGKVIPLIQQFDTAQRALAVAQAGQTSLTEDAAVAQLSLANQFAKVREEFLAMIRAIGGTDTFQTLVKGALALASGLIKLADSAKSVLPVIAAITAFRGLGAARQFGRGFLGGIRGGAAQGNANGGMIRAYKKGGMVPVALMPGETVVYPDTVSKIGVSKLRKLNHADKKMARGGGVGLVPGKGRTDSFYTSLPEGSFVIRTDATRALGGPKGVLAASAGGSVQKFKRGTSQKLKKRPDEPRDEDGRTREQFYADMVSKRRRPIVDEDGRTREQFYSDMVSKRRRPIVDEDGRTREQFYSDMVRDPLDDINRAKRRKFATGGLARLKTSRPYVKDINSTFDKDPNERIRTKIKQANEPLRFNNKDTITANIRRKPIILTEQQLNSVNPDYKNRYLGIDPKTGEQKPVNASVRGNAFENILAQLKYYTKETDNKYSRVDGYKGNSAVEVRSRNEQTSNQILLDKLIGSALFERSASEKIVANKANQTILNKKPNNINAGELIVLEDASSNVLNKAYRTQEEIDKTQEKRLIPKKRVRAKPTNANLGGLIQKFKGGSSKPLESMGRSDLIDEARRLGVGYSYQDLGKRGEIGAQARAKLIQELESKRQIQKVGEQQSATRAAKRQVAVIGLSASEGVRGSSEQVKLPGIKEAGKTQRDLDATLNIGALEGKVSQRTQAVLRNSAIRGSMKAAKVMAQAAGESSSLQSLQQQVALRQKLKSVPSEMMGFGFQSSVLGLQGQMTPSGSADLAGGLSKPYADLFGIPANVPTDVTVGGTEGERLREEAKRKATGTRQSKRGRSGSQFRRAFTGKAFGGILKLASGDMAKANPATESLKKYFRSSSKVNLGLAHSEKLSKEQRQNLAKEVKNIRSLATPAPATVYSAISRFAFNQIARQTGLNKNPEIPEGTTLSQQDKFYQQAVQQMAGKSFKLPGFVSTSKDYSVAKRFLDNTPRDKSKWAAMVTMNMKPKARGIDVEQQLQGQQINNTKTMKNRRSGKMETFKMKGPADEKEVLLPPRSRFRITSAKYAEVFGNKNAWLNVQQLKRGGITDAPLIDDIVGSIPGTYPPVPSGTKLTPALEKIIAAGGGLLDYDGTLMKHTGDEAYARAKTPQEKEAVLSKYYRSEKDRLASGRPTTFARELQKAIKQGLIKPADLSVVSMSKRLPIVEQDIMNRFGIPKDNLIFTQGGSKAKAVEAFRTKGPRASRVSRAGGGDIPILAQEGEYVINRRSAAAIGYGNLNRLNKYHTGGKVQKFAVGDVVASRTSSGAVQFDKSRVTLAKEILELATVTGSGATTLKQAFVEAGAKMDAAVAALPSASAAKTAERAAQKGANVALTPKNPALMPGVPGSKVPAQTGFDKTQTAAPTRLERVTQNITNRMVKAWRETGQTGIDAAAKVKQTYDRVYQAEFKKSAKALKAGNDIAKLEQAKRQAEARALLVATQVASKQNNLPGVSRQKKGAFGGATFKATTAATQFVISGGMDEANKNAKRQNARANRGRGLGLGQRMQLSGAQKIGGGFISSTMGETQMGIGKAIAGVNSSLTSLRNSLTRSGSGFGRTLNSASTASKNYINSINKAPGLFSKLTAAFNPLTKALNSAAGSAFSFGRRNRSGAGGGAGGAAGGSAGRQRGGMGGGIGMGLMFGIPMIADMLAGGEPTSADQARQQAVTTSTATGAGIGAMFGPVGMVVGALGGFALGLANSQKAVDKFTIDKAKANIEDNGEKISRVLEDISKAGKSTPAQLEELNRALASSVDASLEAAEAMRPKRSFGQMAVEALTATYLGGDIALEGSGSQMARSAIYEKQGFMGLIRAQLGGAGTEQQMFQDIAPAMARETSKAFASVAAQARSVFEQQFKSGQSIEDIINTPAWAKQSEVLARSNAAIQEQLLLIEANSALSDREKEARSRSLIATEAETQLRKQFAEIKAAEDLKKLQSAINRVSFSFNRMLGNMDSSIQRSVDNLEKFNNSVSLASASAAGQAKVGSGGVQDIINVLKNPQAYGGAERSAAFSAAASSFGSQSGNIQSILSASAGLESNILGTINRTLTGSKGETDEAVAGKITSAVKDQLRNLQIPPAIADKLSEQIGAAVGQLRSRGEDTVVFTQLVETVPEIAKSIDIFKNTADQASKALEFNKKAFDTLADATNQYIDLIVESNSRLRAAQSIVAKGSMDLKRALGGNVSLGERRAAIEAPIRSMTGGLTDPGAIAANQRRLEADRARLQSGRDQAARSQDVGAVRAFDNQLAQTSISLRENVAALKQMADSSELASAALEEIDKAQKKQQAGIGIMEKLVTSTPKDLSKMNQAFARLDANMRGIAIGGTSPEQRKETLDMFQMIAPFLGDQEKGLQANVLQSMLMESGVGVNPMMQQILDGMRNPQMDPQQAAAIATYQQAIDTQARANEQLAIINQNLAEDISKKTGDAVAAAIANTSVRFEDKQLNDLLNGINVVPTPANPAATLATGGIVYKALGGNIDRTIFKPKGTDTVPAMLTPGEFVVNRQATQANLPLLKSINNGYSRGGTVKYLAAGGFVSNILKPTASSVDTVKTGISTEELPALDPALVPSSKKSSHLSAAPATVFAGLGAPQGPDKNLTDMLTTMRSIIKSGAANNQGGWLWGDSITTYPEFFTKSGDQDFKNLINKPLSLTNPKPTLGFAPNIKFETVVSGGGKWVGGTYVIPTATQAASNPGGLQLTSIGEIPFGYEDVQKLTASATIDPIKRMKLNNGSFGDVTLDDYAALSNISADSQGANAYIQSNLMDKILWVLDNDFKRIKEIKNKLIFPNSITGSVDFGLPQKVDDLYNKHDIFLSTKIDGMMYPTITSKEVASVGIPPATTTFPSPSDFSLGIYKPTIYGAGKSGGYEIPSNVGFPQIDKTSIDNMVSSLSGYRENISKARDELYKKIKVSNIFSGTSDIQQQYSNIFASLKKVYDGNISGLYETIKIDPNELDDGWKSLIDNPLHIFNNITPRQWTDAITRAKNNSDPSFKNKFLDLKGYGVGAHKLINIKTDNDKQGRNYPWLSGNKDTVQTFVDKYFEGQQRAAEEAYQSPFKIGEETKNHIFDTGIPLAHLDPGLGKGTLKAAFGYRDIVSMPWLSPDNGYNPAAFDSLDGGVLIESGPASVAADQTITDVLKLREGHIGIDTDPLSLQRKINKALAEYINKNNKNASISGLWRAKRITTADAGWIAPQEKNGFGILGQLDPIQIDDAVRNFKNNSLITGGAQANRVVGAQISPIGNPWTAAVSLLKNVIMPEFGTLRKFGYSLAPLSTAAEIGPYSQGLMSLSKQFGQRIVNPQDGSVDNTLAQVWGKITAVGEVMELISRNDMAGLSRKIGLAQSAAGSGGVVGLIQQVKTYGSFLADQGIIMAGVSGQARQVLERTIHGDQMIATTGGKPGQAQRLNDIFEGATEATIGQDGKISSTQATPPKNLLDIGKKALNPYNTFAQPNDRASLLDYLLNQLISQKVNRNFIDQWVALRDYLYDQDEVLAAKNPVAVLTDNVRQDMDSRYMQANKVLLSLTNGEFGQLPNTQKILELAAFRKSQQQAQKEADKKSTGGVVYASTGTLVNYQPRGTDTVPAMLTPGEFVVNRSSTQKHLPLLRAINSGSNNLTSLSSSFSNGGLVNYLQNGGVILPKYYSNGTSGVVAGGGTASGMPKVALDASKAGQQITDALTTGTNALSQILRTFGFDSNQLNAISGFINGLKTVTDALANVNITPTVKFEMAPVQVNITGASNLTQAAESIVNGVIEKWFTDFLDKNQQANMTPPSPYNK